MKQLREECEQGDRDAYKKSLEQLSEIAQKIQTAIYIPSNTDTDTHSDGKSDGKRMRSLADVGKGRIVKDIAAAVVREAKARQADDAAWQERRDRLVRAGLLAAGITDSGRESWPLVKRDLLVPWADHAAFYVDQFIRPASQWEEHGYYYGGPLDSAITDAQKKYAKHEALLDELKTNVNCFSKFMNLKLKIKNFVHFKRFSF
jgi:hypothetical protein